MFTIEHEFDCTVITVVDEGPGPLREDLVVRVYDDRIVLEQYDAEHDDVSRIMLSLDQAEDLAASISLPEGIYARLKDGSGGGAPAS